MSTCPNCQNYYAGEKCPYCADEHENEQVAQPAAKQEEKKSGGCGWGCLLFILIPILFFAVFSASNSERREQAKQTYQSSLSTLAGASDQEKLEYAAKYVYGDSLIGVRATNQYPTVSVKKTGSAETIKLSANINALAMLEKIKEIREMYGFDFKIFQFEIYTTLVDVYGNESDGLVLSFGITDETLDRINFKNMVSSNIPKIAIDWYEHPAIK